MTISSFAGKPAPQDILVDLARLERAYYTRRPDMADPTQLVSFGTSGHRGSPRHGSFTEAHILAITQAICDYRQSQGTDGPLYMGKDTHVLSGPAQRRRLPQHAAAACENWKDTRKNILGLRRTAAVSNLQNIHRILALGRVA